VGSRRGRRIQEAEFGADFIGALRFQRGDYEGALTLLRRVLYVDEQTLGPEHPAVATVLDKLGVVLVVLERPGEAVPLHERALAIRELREGAEHMQTAQTLVYLCEALLLDDHATQAMEACARAVALEGRFEAPELLARARFLQARARWATGERARARSEAAATRAAYAAAGLDECEIDRWLAAH
jgi:hypothetical protein